MFVSFYYLNRFNWPTSTQYLSLTLPPTSQNIWVSRYHVSIGLLGLEDFLLLIYSLSCTPTSNPPTLGTVALLCIVCSCSIWDCLTLWRVFSLIIYLLAATKLSCMSILSLFSCSIICSYTI